ncbi:MAG: sulfotransferase [Phycisphaera sp.]|nr:MAG: sulfotransferase [Phycisphaera sp.]
MPVFVAGMPRSGTSFVDPVINAHPLAVSVGALNPIEKFAGKPTIFDFLAFQNEFDAGCE